MPGRAARGIALAAAFMSLVCAPGARAQQLEPRAYSNVPVGINFLIVGYGYASGAVLPDPSLPAEDVTAQIHTVVGAYSRSLDLWGKSGQVSVVVPYVKGSVAGRLEGVPQAVDRYGLADPAVKLAVNLTGAPALSVSQFAAYRQRTILGVSLQVTAPVGQYDPAKLVNIGTNRWSVKAEIGVSHTLGHWTLEGALGTTFYTVNDEYFGDRTREQDPLYAMQFHVVYSIRFGMWAALDGTYYTGGRTTVDGQKRDDLQSNWRWGATFALPVNRYNSLKLYAHTGVFTRTGTDFDVVGVAWQYRWGGGL
jgi:hypothetical protein